jgi:hypothetical protein
LSQDRATSTVIQEAVSMETFKRLAMAYLGVGFIVTVIENWTAHTTNGTSAIDALFGIAPIGDKLAVVLSQIIVPIVAWPFHLWGLLHGG